MSERTIKLQKTNAKYSLELTAENTYFYLGELYISSKKAAEFFGSTFHVFSNYHVPWLIKYNLARRVTTGKSKWYAFSDLEKLMAESIDRNINLYSIYKSKKRQKQKRKLR